MALSNAAKSDIEKFDVKLDNSIQLNSSKVPAQQGIFSLVVSAGGTGRDALLETKGMINKTCCLSLDAKDQPTRNVAYRCFDTDAASLNQCSSSRSGGAKLSERDGEFVRMEAPNIATYLSTAFRSQVPNYVSEWLDFRIDPTINGSDGAGGVRQCGRLLMFQNVDRIRESIASAIRTMTAGQEVIRLNIYVMAGVGGGTGSGTFLDLAYIARDVAESILPNKVTSYGYIFMPDVNLSRPLSEETRTYIRRNGYAALRELDYTMNMHADGGRFTQRYSNTYVIDTERAPFNYVHLVSASGSSGMVQVLKEPYLHGMWAVAQSVLSFVAQEQREDVNAVFAMQSHYVNIKTGVDNHQRKFPERQSPYLALGTYNYELPIDHILLYVTSLLFDKMDSMFDNYPTQQQADQAYNALGLAPNVLLSSLAGAAPAFVPANCTWEDLFGKNPRYNLGALCNQWVDVTTVDVKNRGKGFLEDFAGKFRRLSEAWFTDAECGPIWLNRLLIAASEDCTGLLAKLDKDYTIAGSQIAKYKVDVEKLRQKVNGAAREASTAAALVGNRDGKKKDYIDALNEYATACIRMVALAQMQTIYEECAAVLRDMNSKQFEVVTSVLEALKDVCRSNADILTDTEMTSHASGRTFTWKPISIPDVSDLIKQAFDAKGDAAQTIKNFTTALLSHAYEWADGNVDVRGFICEYLDKNLSDIANNSLEDYVKAILNNAMSLDASVQAYLAPEVIKQSEPLFAQTTNADVGGEMWMVSIPYSCPNILAAFKAFRAANPDYAAKLTIQSSAINNRIFAQSVKCAVPLSAYAPMSEYEQIFLTSIESAGLFLRTDWSDLPSPIPYRSRPKAAGMYPPAIQQVEDRQRALYKACREVPVIRMAEMNNQLAFHLHIAKLPDLNAEFSEQKMRGEGSNWDVPALEEAKAKLENWLTNGLPDRDLSDSVHNTFYEVMHCAVPETDADRANCEVAAGESLLGQYNNLRRAAEELEKYNAVKAKLAEVEEWYRQAEGVARQARTVVCLLVSGTVRMARDENEDLQYCFQSGERQRVLVKLGDQGEWREMVLCQQIDAMAASAEPLKRDQIKSLCDKADREYKRMDADACLTKLEALKNAVETRYETMRDDLSDGFADPRVTYDTLNFYEKLIRFIEREMRTRKRAPKASMDDMF